MPDITMCKGVENGVECPWKENCYRYKAVADIRQSYFVFTPYDFVEDSCVYFMSVDEKLKGNKMICKH